MKICIEWTAALLLSVPIIPVLIILAALVKLTSRGPAFYAQLRVGRNGRNFLMYKLRTMTHGCEAQSGPVWSPPNDVRVTTVGRFLRKTHFDELPQLLNVLQGHMTLIGPRPERPELCTRIARKLPRFCERLQLRPGLTGLAQVRLAADTNLNTVRRKLAHDLYYVREVHPVLDLRVALATVLYMIAIALQSLGSFLTKSYGQAVEPDGETDDQFNEEGYEMPAEEPDVAPLAVAAIR